MIGTRGKNPISDGLRVDRLKTGIWGSKYPKKQHLFSKIRSIPGVEDTTELVDEGERWVDGVKQNNAIRT